MNIPRLIVAGTHSGVGKTTVTIGLMAALKSKGLIVQGFKTGPDFIDPGYHTAVTGRSSRNLDSWMLSQDGVREVFCRGSRGSDVSVIEGVMGLYDGKEPSELTGSTAELAILLQAPVILVINAEGMAGSAAAVVLGFQSMEPKVHVAGVIVNCVGSFGHYQLLKRAIEDRCGVPVIGYLEREREIDIPERHLGLIPSVELAVRRQMFDRLATLISESVDLDRLIKIARKAPEVHVQPAMFLEQVSDPKVKIAVAKDTAFHFYYQENLELLELNGAELVFFRPLEGECIPSEADGLYIGGGFPEEFAEKLSAHRLMLNNLRDHIRSGLPTLAECGGYMLLAESITDRHGATYSMAGVVPAAIRMQSRLAALGYREVIAAADSPILAKGDSARGHEFHYSVIEYRMPQNGAYRYYYRDEWREEGFSLPNLSAGYTHLHFGSNPKIAARFVEACRKFRSR